MKATVEYYLPDTYKEEKQYVLELKKIGKVSFYKSDGTHGIKVIKEEVQGEQLKVTVICLCCETSKNDLVFYLPKKFTASDNLIEINNVLAGQKFWKSFFKDILW